MIIFNIKINGKPIENFLCIVLCLKIFIDMIIPRAPPKIAVIKRLCSDILHPPVFDLILSYDIKKKEKMFIENKYNVKNSFILKFITLFTPTLENFK
jgi:hypothetical protein